MAKLLELELGAARWWNSEG